MQSRMASQAVLAVLLVSLVAIGDAGFTKYTVQQSSPLPGDNNTITVYFRLNVSISLDTGITLKGLTGASVANPSNVSLTGTPFDGRLFSNAGCGSRGEIGFARWDSALEGVIFYPLETIAADTDLVVQFSVINPDVAYINNAGVSFGDQAAPNVQLETSGAVPLEAVNVWTTTQLVTLGFKADMDNASCIIKTAPPTLRPSAASGDTTRDYNVSLEYFNHFPKSFSFNLSNSSVTSSTGATCEGETGTIVTSGVFAVDVTKTGCGCESLESAQLSRAITTGNFKGTLKTVYHCVDISSGSLLSSHPTEDACALACRMSETVGASGVSRVCTGLTNSSMVTIDHPGWDFTTPPSVTVSVPGCDITLNTRLSVGSDFEGTYSIKDGVVTVESKNVGRGYRSNSYRFSSKTADGCNFGDNVVITALPEHIHSVDIDRNFTGTCDMTQTIMRLVDMPPSECHLHENPEIGWSLDATTPCNQVLEVREGDMKTPKATPTDDWAIWSIYGDAAPMKVYSQRLLFHRVWQSTCNPQHSNTYTVSLVPSFSLRQSVHKMTIHGLSSALREQSKIEIRTAGSTADHAQFTGEWLCDGMLEVSFLSTVPAGTLVSFEFSVMNPSTARAASDVFVTINEQIFNSTMIRTVVDSQVMDTSTSAATQKPNLVCAPEIRDARVFQWYAYPRYYSTAPTVRLGNVDNALSTAARENNIFIRFKTNFQIATTTKIEVKGLTGITDPDGTLTLAGVNVSAFRSKFCDNQPTTSDATTCTSSDEGRATWDADTFSASFFPIQPIAADQEIKLQLTAVMQPATVSSITVRITQHRQSENTDSVIYKGIEASVAVTGDSLGMDPNGDCPNKMWNQNFAETKPFAVRAPKLTRKSIVQTRPYLGAGLSGSETNTLRVTLQLNVPLFQDDSLTLTALSGDNFTDSVGSTATLQTGELSSIWAATHPTNPLQQYKLVLTPQTSNTMGPGWIHEIVTQHSNPLVSEFTTALDDRLSSQVQVNVNFVGTTTIAASSMTFPNAVSLGDDCTTNGDYNAFRMLRPTFCVAQIWQSTSVPAETNNIFVTLRPTFDITTTTNITITGWIGDQQPSAGIGQSTFEFKRVGTSGDNYEYIISGHPWGDGSSSDAGSELVLNFTVTNANFSRTVTAGITLVSADFDHINTFKVQANNFGGDSTAPTTSNAGTASTIQQDLVEPAAPTDLCDIDNRPLHLKAPRICKCVISQSSDLPGVTNLITVSYQATVDYPVESFFNQKNWTLRQQLPDASTTLTDFLEPGTIPSSDSGVTFIDIDAYTLTTASSGSVPSTGYVRDVIFTHGASSRATGNSFSYNVTNPVKTSDLAPTFWMFIGGGISSGTLSEQSAIVEDPPSGLTAAQYTSTLTGTWSKYAIQCESTVVVKRTEFTTAWVGQTRPYPSMTNNIVVTLATNYARSSAWWLQLKFVPTTAQESIFLTSSSTKVIDRQNAAEDGADGVVCLSVPGTINGAYLPDTCGGSPTETNLENIFTDVAATSIQCNGTIARFKGSTQKDILIPVSTGFQSATQYIFSFVVNNPPTAFDTVAMSIGGWTSEPTSLSGTPDLFSLQTLHGPTSASNTATDKTYSNCSGWEIYSLTQEDAMPLKVRAPALISGSTLVSQSSPFPGQANVITVSLQFNVHIPGTTSITITKLRDLTNDPDQEDVILGATTDLDTTQKTESQPSTGIQLVLTAAAQPQTAQGRLIEFTLSFTNPTSIADANYETEAGIEVALSGNIAMSLTKIDVPVTVTLQPFYILRPALTSKVIYQETPYAGSVNTVTMIFGTNVPLLQGTILVVSNIYSNTGNLDFAASTGEGQNTLVPFYCGDGRTVPDKDSDYFTNANDDGSDTEQTLTGETQTCANNEGGSKFCELRLRIRVKRQTSANQAYRLSFKIRNPLTSISPTVSIRSTASSDSVVTVPPTAFQTLDRSCDQCSLPGDSSILNVRPNEFRAAASRQTSPWPMGWNTLFVEFSPNGTIEHGSLLTIDGFPSTFSQSIASTGISSQYLTAIVVDDDNNGDAGNNCTAGEIFVNTSTGQSKIGSYTASCGSIFDTVVNCWVLADSVLDINTGNLKANVNLIFDNCGAQPSVAQVKVYAADLFQSESQNSGVNQWAVSNGQLKMLAKFDKNAANTLNRRIARCMCLEIGVQFRNPVIRPWSTTGMTVSSEPVNTEGSTLSTKSIDLDPNMTVAESMYQICPWTNPYSESCNPTFGYSLPIVAGDAFPFKLYEPAIVYAKIAQSSSYPGEFNIITCTLKFNIAVDVGTQVHVRFDMGSRVAPAAPTFEGYETTSAASTLFEITSATNETGDGSGDNSVWTVTLDRALTNLARGDYIKTMVVDSFNRVGLFKVIGVMDKTLVLYGGNSNNDPDLSAYFIEPQSSGTYKTIYIAKTVYVAQAEGVTPSLTDPFQQEGQWNNSMGADKPQLDLTVKTALEAGRDYVFRFMVLNDVPESTAQVGGAISIVASAPIGVNGEYVTKLADVPTPGYLTSKNSQGNFTVSEAVLMNTTLLKVTNITAPRLNYVGPGSNLLIEDEIVTILKMTDRSGSEFIVARGQMNTEIKTHVVGSIVSILTAGTEMGDANPFKLSRPRVVVKYARQNSALPGAQNRIFMSFAANFPMNADTNFTIGSIDAVTISTFASNGLATFMDRTQIYNKILAPGCGYQFDGIGTNSTGLGNIDMCCTIDGSNIASNYLTVTNVTDRAASSTSPTGSALQLQLATNLVSYRLREFIGFDNETIPLMWSPLNFTSENYTVQVNITTNFSGVDVQLSRPVGIQYCRETAVTSPPSYLKFGDIIRINNEVIMIGKACRMLRGQQGTLRSEHAENSTVLVLQETVPFGDTPLFFDEVSGSATKLRPETGDTTIPTNQLMQFTLDVWNHGAHLIAKKEATDIGLTLSSSVLQQNIELTENFMLHNGTVFNGIQDFGPRSIETDTVYGDGSDLAPGTIYAKGFIVKGVHQTKDNPGTKTNTITITLVPTIPISDTEANETTIVVGGLTGASVTGTLTEVTGGESGQVLGFGEWDSSGQNMMLTLATGLRAGERFTVSFTVTNPARNQTNADVQIYTQAAVQKVTVSHKNISECNCPVPDGIIGTAVYRIGVNSACNGGGSGLQAVWIHNQDTVTITNPGSGFKFSPMGTCTTGSNIGGSVVPQSHLDAHTRGTPVLTFTECPDRADVSLPKCGCDCDLDAMFIAAVDGILEVRNFSVNCYHDVTDGTLLVEDNLGFGIGFEAKFDTANIHNFSWFSFDTATNLTLNNTDFIYNTTDLRIVNHGSGYKYIPYSQGFETCPSSAACSCDAQGNPSGPDSCRCRGPRFKLGDDAIAKGCVLVSADAVVAGPVLMQSNSMTHPTTQTNKAMYVAPPVFTISTVKQESPWVGAFNRITVTMTSNAYLPVQTTITIAGFDGATPDVSANKKLWPNSLLCDNNPTAPCVFSSDSPTKTATGTDWNGIYVFEIDLDQVEETALVVGFNVNNPDLIAPSINRPVNLTVEMNHPNVPETKYIAPIDMTNSMIPAGGIDKASAVLSVYTDTWPQCFKDPVDPVTEALTVNVWELTTREFLSPGVQPPFFGSGQSCDTCQESGIVRAIGFSQIEQSNCRASTTNNKQTNRIKVVLKSNVPLADKCKLPCISGAKIDITGLFKNNFNRPADLAEADRASIKDLDTATNQFTLLYPDAGILDNGSPNPQQVSKEVFGDKAQYVDSDALQTLGGTIELSIQTGQVMIPGDEHVIHFEINNPTQVMTAPTLTIVVFGGDLDRGYDSGTSGTDGPGPACYFAGGLENAGSSNHSDLLPTRKSAEWDTCRSVHVSTKALMVNHITSPPLDIVGSPFVTFNSFVLTRGSIESSTGQIALSFSINNGMRLRQNQRFHIGMPAAYPFSVNQVSISAATPFNGNTQPFASAEAGTVAGVGTYFSLVMGAVSGGSIIGPRTITVTVEGVGFPSNGYRDQIQGHWYDTIPLECQDGDIHSLSSGADRAQSQIDISLNTDTMTAIVATMTDPYGRVDESSNLLYQTASGIQQADTEVAVTAAFTFYHTLSTTDEFTMTLPNFAGPALTDAEGGDFLVSFTGAGTTGALLTLKPKEAYPNIFPLSGSTQTLSLSIPSSAGIKTPPCGESSPAIPVNENFNFAVAAGNSIGSARVENDVSLSGTAIYCYKCIQGPDELDGVTGYVTATNTASNFCDGTHIMRMCAQDSASLLAYINAEGLRGAAGYIQGTGGAVTVGNTTVAAGSPLDNCGAQLTAECSQIGGTPALQSSTIGGFLDERSLQAICCKHSPIASISLGLGNMGTCKVDADCEGINGNEASVSTVPGVAKPITTTEDDASICCDYCYIFYGTMGCRAADGSARGATDSNVLAFCNNVKQCASSPPCYGTTLESTGLVVDVAALGDGGELAIQTDNGDGVVITAADLPAGGVPGGQPITITEISPASLPAAAAAAFTDSASGGGTGSGDSPAATFRLAGNILSTGPEFTFARAIDLVMSYTPSTSRRRLLQANKGDAGVTTIIIHELIEPEVGDAYWKPVTTTQVNTETFQVTAKITSFGTFAPIETTYPILPQAYVTPSNGRSDENGVYKKYFSSAGDEVYATIGVTILCLLLAWLIIVLPHFAKEPPPPPPPKPVPKPLPPQVFSPPPPSAPLYVRELGPEKRITYQAGSAVPIKHFGPPIPDADDYEQSTDVAYAQTTEEPLPGTEGGDNTHGLLGFPSNGSARPGASPAAQGPYGASQPPFQGSRPPMSYQNNGGGIV